jgi:hypothetical protein
MKGALHEALARRHSVTGTAGRGKCPAGLTLTGQASPL